MSKVRVLVEWIFGDVVNYFKFLDFKKNLKICLSSVGKMYITCALMHNAGHVCMAPLLQHFSRFPPQLSRTTFSDKRNMAQAG